MQKPDKYTALKGMESSLNFILNEMENHQKALTRKLPWLDALKTNLAAFGEGTEELQK